MQGFFKGYKTLAKNGFRRENIFIINVEIGKARRRVNLVTNSMYDLDKTHLKVRMNLPGVHQTQLPLTCFICLIFTIKAIQDHRAGQ